MRFTVAAVYCLFCTWMLDGQTATITSVQNESGSSSLCPGGIAFVRGTNLGNTGTTVTVGSKQAFVFNASGGGTSLQLELPVDAPLGATTMKAGNSAAFNITLVQFCPGIPTDGQPDSVASAFHYPSGVAVTPSFPASPNEQIALGATGLGPTNPPVATGNAPNDNSAKVVTLPTLSLAGKPVTVSDAFLQPNSPGFYAVVFTVPASATAGNLSVSVSIGGLTSETAVLPVATGPIVASMTNAASYNDPALPNGPIAQGSIFVIKGVNLGPSNITIAPNAFQSATLSGTSASVTINGTTVQPLMYYTSASQVAALMPSNTPVGTGTITLTYNNQPGPAAPIRVVASNLGIFTVTSDGQGAGIVTYADYSLVSTTKSANCGGVNTTCGAANPGDALIVWATGLGPVSGSDASGAGLGVNMTSIPLTIWLGSTQMPAVYQGRSGCCIGEDQIVFTVPANAPTGCAVPLSVQIGNLVSNTVALPIAQASRTCTPADPTFTTATVALVSNPGTFTYGEVDLRHRDDSPGFDDTLKGQFIRFTVPAAVQPFFMSYADQPPVGTCQVTNNLNGSNPPLNIVSAVDVGSPLTVQGPNGSKGANVSGGQFNTSLSDTGTFIAPGTYTISAPGGADAPAFKVSLTFPTLPTMTSPQVDAPNPIPVTRANGLTVTWSGGQANALVEIEVFSPTDNTSTIGTDAVCWAPAAAGTFTVPANVLLALPPGNLAGLAFRPYAPYGTLTGSGLSVSKLIAWNVYFTPLSFK